MEYCKLFIAVLLLVSGCAHQSNELYNTMNNCNVSIQTKPSNANVNIVTRSAYKYMGDIVFNESVSHYCNTPYNGVISSKEKTVFLFVEKEGFEQESIYVDMKNNKVNFNIVMEEAFELQIKKKNRNIKKN